jgi:uncharacterized protein (TIGR02145 family)
MIANRLHIIGVLLVGLIIFAASCDKPNTPPVADFSFSPATGNTDTVFTFDASSSFDKEDDATVLQVHWDWTNDGVWDTEFSSNKIINHQFSDLKVHTVVLEVRDTRWSVNSLVKTVSTVPSLPVIDSVVMTNVGAFSAHASCRILKNGGASVQARGVCWSINQSPTIINDSTIDGNGIGEYTSHITGLKLATVYYVRAYATSIAGIGYGDEISFTTEDVEEGSFIDERDNQEYETIWIGTQKWMAENLAYLPEVSPASSGSESSPYYYVYDYEDTSVSAAKATDNYDKYGALYNWEGAKTACPSDWHLPSDEEWKILETYLGMSSLETRDEGWRYSGDVGKKLKSTSDWNSSSNGTNSSGLSVLPGGDRSTFDVFYSLGNGANFWTSSSYGSSKAWNRHLYYTDDGVYRDRKGNLSLGFSVRCIQD